VKGKGVSKFVGVLPVISRFFRYIGATLEEAQKDVAAAYAEPAKPVMGDVPKKKSKKKKVSKKK
ncbi:MAG: hypothetical protein Q7R56_00390, partial [Nanoarchaeota archaeon]|nr:hypothetical protein [Nanoarchaeota archaeon]